MVVPIAPIAPVITLSRRAPGGGSLRSRVSAATQVTITDATSWEMTIGHRSLAEPASLRPMKNIPNPSTGSRPSPHTHRVAVLAGGATPLEPPVA